MYEKYLQDPDVHLGKFLMECNDTVYYKARTTHSPQEFTKTLPRSYFEQKKIPEYFAVTKGIGRDTNIYTGKYVKEFWERAEQIAKRGFRFLPK